MTKVIETRRELQVVLTEQTLLELRLACEEAKKESSKNTVVIVGSEYSKVDFAVHLGNKGTQESLGYKLKKTFAECAVLGVMSENQEKSG